MNESFLHYLWEFQYFDKSDLCSTSGDRLSILKTGHRNSNSGPDFTEAKIRINDMEWIGTVEIHIKSSDWHAHHHEQDPAYDNVVLHVVWEDDLPVRRTDSTLIPTLQLQPIVEERVWRDYKKLVNSTTAIACEKSLIAVDDIVKLSMIQKSAMQRMERKAAEVYQVLKANNGDWEETCYQLLACNFGFKVNADPFLQLAKSLPYRLVLKQNHLLQVEALLFGQAGMLETKTRDEYITALFADYRALAQKYTLHRSQLAPSQWRFLRLRPANFPTVRLAQLAAILFSSKNIFSKLILEGSYESIWQVLSAGQSSYWNSHYRFGKKALGIVPDLGQASIQNILINTVAPLLVAYGKRRDEQAYVDKAIDILQKLPAEKNRITRAWSDLGFNGKSALDSQGSIELFNNFCQRRQCLNCAIGVSILKPDS